MITDTFPVLEWMRKLSVRSRCILHVNTSIECKHLSQDTEYGNLITYDAKPYVSVYKHPEVNVSDQGLTLIVFTPDNSGGFGIHLHFSLLPIPMEGLKEAIERLN